jgi:hypothetical protein
MPNDTDKIHQRIAQTAISDYMSLFEESSSFVMDLFSSELENSRAALQKDLMALYEKHPDFIYDCSFSQILTEAIKDTYIFTAPSDASEKYLGSIKHVIQSYRPKQKIETSDNSTPYQRLSEYGILDLLEIESKIHIEGPYNGIRNTRLALHAIENDIRAVLFENKYDDGIDIGIVPDEKCLNVKTPNHTKLLKLLGLEKKEEA